MCCFVYTKRYDNFATDLIYGYILKTTDSRPKPNLNKIAISRWAPIGTYFTGSVSVENLTALNSVKTSQRFFIVSVALILAGLTLYSLIHIISSSSMQQPKPGATQQAPHRAVGIPVASHLIIDLKHIENKSDKALCALMAERRETYGAGENIGMIVHPDETIKVGDTTVQMKDILDEIQISRGQIIETDLTAKNNQRQTNAFGIYVARPGENIWNVHFKLLREYYEKKGIKLSPTANDTLLNGKSSDGELILKFSDENVHIYDLALGRAGTDLSTTQPLKKVVIYDMEHTFGLLGRINYEDIARIEFDGESLWLPAQAQ